MEKHLMAVGIFPAGKNDSSVIQHRRLNLILVAIRKLDNMISVLVTFMKVPGRIVAPPMTAPKGLTAC